MSYTPYAHQQYIFDRGKTGSLLIGAEPGCGKTLIGLMLAEHYKANPIKTGRTLVVAPLSLLECAWIDDLKKFTPNLSYTNLWANTPAKRAKLLKAAAKSTICLINFQGFTRIEAWARQQQFDCLFVDESSGIRNPKAQITKALWRFAMFIPRVYPASGTPMPNSPLDLYFQVDCVKRGLLGQNFYQFRSNYAYPSGYMGHLWKVSAPKLDAIMKLIQPHAVTVKKSECLDLPPKVFESRKCYMSPEQRKAYNQMLEEKILPLVDDQVALAPNALAECTRLRQITSGWVKAVDGKNYDFADTKAKVLDEVLEEIGPQPVLIWICYRHDAEILAKRLGDKAVIAYGGMGPEALKTNIDSFKSGAKQYLIAHPQTVAHGHTMVNCSYAVYYSLDYNLENFLQSQDRLHRIGQKADKITYIMLLADDSIDEVILKALTKKDNMATAAMDYLRSYKKGE